MLHIDSDRCDSKNYKTLVVTRARVREIQRKSHLSFCNSAHYPQKVGFHPSFSRHGITPASSVLLIWLNENGRTKKQANVCANLYGFFSEKGRFFLEKCRTFSEKHRTFPRKCRILSEKARIFSQESALTLQKQATFSSNAGKKR